MTAPAKPDPLSVTADRPLAEIVAEGRAMCRPDWQGPKGYAATFRAEHFARLLAVAKAAVEWRRDTRDDADARLAAVVDDAAKGGGR